MLTKQHRDNIAIWLSGGTVGWGRDDGVDKSVRELLNAYDALTVPSPEPAAKTELTAEEQDFRDYIASVPNLTMGDAERILRLLDEHAAMRDELTRLRSDLSACQETSAELSRSYIAAHDRAHAAQSRIAELESALEQVEFGYEMGFDDGTQSWQLADAESDAEFERIKAMPIEDVEKELRDAGVDVELFEKSTMALVKACKERNQALARIAELESALALATEALAARAKVEADDASGLIEAIDGYMNSTQADSSFALKGPAANRVRDLLKARARREAAKAKGDGNG